MEYIIKTYPKVTRITRHESARIYNSEGAYHDVENTNEIVDSIDGLIASKTGYTELAGGNLVVAFDAGLNHPIIITVLGSTFSDRFTDIHTLTEATKTYLATKQQQ